ncbi:TonB-linked outer membrane protein, SusC/RagA family [Sinomicrobium oceani]|uniref:TonB-linked outer membrane protein, SusC/RagA family n=2 Tax=Sinomicrobium oceani TaxID=1150368 RepID=A0A1K1RVH5_9FLAO|nr:TonB-linked outer membrane protein, SusC/RagA family [Sinomicrobium oceani]
MKHATLAGLSRWCPITIALILLSLPLPAMALPSLQINDQHQVTGTVTDSNGEPLGGVNIIVSGKGQGTISGFDGSYTLTAIPQDTLVYSFVGFKTRKERVGERLTLDVVLQEDVMALGEVTVNAGYYTVKEKERTGSISRIRAEDIGKQPVSNPLAAMQGRMPGVEVVQSTGVPGGGFQVRIRGQNSIAAGNDPLYIVDGVPFTSQSVASLGLSITHPATITPLTAINPADIESIEVLKDADATAIYGSRGANGVVLITTKKGKAGKTSVEVNMQTGVGQVAHTMKLLNTPQYLDMRREAFANDGVTPTETNAPDLLLWDQNRYTDWQKELIGGTAYTTDARLSVSGGSENTRFSVRGGYYKETTVFPGDFDYQRMSLQSNLNHTSTNEKFGISLTMGFTREESDLLNQDLTRDALMTPPNVPAFINEKGNLMFPLEGTGMNNPYTFIKRKYRKEALNFMTNAVLYYDLWPGLRTKISLGYTNMTNDERSTAPASSQNPVLDPVASAGFADGKYQSWIMEPQLEYTRTWGQGTLNILFGCTFQENTRDRKGVTATGFTSDALIENMAAASDIRVETTEYNKYRYNAFFGRINYNWKGKYLVNLTGRRDGSSRFGPGKQFSNFGAVGVAWVFSEENFIRKGIPFLSFGKLRASYGVTGNDQIGDYEFLDTYSLASFPYHADIGLYPTRLFNPDFAWEQNRKLEGTLELGFFKDHIFLSIGYYRNRSGNQLINLPLPPSTGFAAIRSNLSALVENTGWEVELNTTNIQTHHLQWRTSANFTVPRNKLLEYPGFESSVHARQYEIGKSLFIQKKLHYTEVDPGTGVYQFEDVNQDGVVSSPDDLRAIYEITQDFYGGLNNSITYKNWQLDVFFQFVKQTGRNYLNMFSSAPGFLGNQPTEVLERWQHEGDRTGIQKFTQQSGEAGQAYRTARLQGDYLFGDASFVRLKNLAISYQLPVVNTPFQMVRIYMQGQNLLTLTRFAGLDPENHSYTTLPPLRVITGGVQFIF